MASRPPQARGRLSRKKAITAAMELIAEHGARSGQVTVRAMSYLADDVVCEAPGVVIKGVSDYRSYIEEFNGVFIDADRLASYGDGDTAVIVQVLHHNGIPSAKAMTRFTVENGKITHALMIFDRVPYMEARQAAQAASR